MNKIQKKTQQEIETMREGGRLLAEVRMALIKAVQVGGNAQDIDSLAEKLIVKVGGTPSFKMVPGYFWSTCINVNAGVVHGIPKKSLVFKENDLVSIDVGMFYKGFHTDTSDSLLLGKNQKLEKFLESGKNALKKAISQAKPGNFVSDISQAIQDSLSGEQLNPIWALTGHGIGRALHEQPYIPGFVRRNREKSLLIEPGMVFAIEVMYTPGNGQIVTDKDGWTILTEDGKISALFEETVAVTKKGPVVVTTKENGH